MVSSMEHASSNIYVAFWLFSGVQRKHKFYMLWLKAYNCPLFTNFHHAKLYSFRNPSLGFIIYILLSLCRALWRILRAKMEILAG